MNIQDMREFMGMAGLVCVLGVVLNLFMLRKRGTSAALLAAAFSCFAVGLFILYFGAAVEWAVPFAVLVLLLLGLDIALRLKKLGGSP